MVAPIIDINAQAFRAAIRPSLVGFLGELEPAIAAEAAEALDQWLRQLVAATMATTKLKDPNGIVYAQLSRGIKITGAYGLNQLRGRIDVQPWLFAQEFGAHITPKKTKFLTIPLLFALRGDGTLKYNSATSWQRWGSFVYTDRNTGVRYLAYKGADGELRLLYLLVEWTDLKPILGLTNMAEKNIGQLAALWGGIYVNAMASSGLLDQWGV